MTTHDARKRKFERRPVSLPAIVRVAGRELPAVAENISPGGAFLRGRLVARLTRVHGTLFVSAHVHHGSGLCSINDDSGSRVRALGFLGDAAILSFVEDIRLRFLRLPRRSLRNA